MRNAELSNSKSKNYGPFTVTLPDMQDMAHADSVVVLA